MGITKSEVFNAQQNQIAEYAKALAHPARVAILQELIRQKTCICGDLVDVLPLSQSTISQHLKELKRIGLIKGEVEGPKICYCIHEENWSAAQAMLNQLFGSFATTTCC
ncbi:Helix-turn-helix domain-containing protein [Catalinimonas alkaloidigena]|uniref:Helix-turn-helix domain-containing protein n=1 Tax=Catalinimonas alkaloidigena TaxID=1075417 RepID=A0A1G8ZWZ1_9BACT|nr:metalloregulator ArsR/SmtB family transcription factor [Catalinimonas alkaloidigena]SDK18845.1 Helix-turn-helix domain-containing protein [Catalinimonas alkaloidigena]